MQVTVRDNYKICFHESLWDACNRAFYEVPGLQHILRHLLTAGMFVRGSNNLPDDEFTERLANVIVTAGAKAIVFDNPDQTR